MEIQIKDVNSREFRRYGKILKQINIEQITGIMEETPVPGDVIYIPSDKRLEQTREAEYFKDRVFGGMPIQIGYCNGHNRKLNAVEYHRNSEINIAIDDLILILGMQQDIEENYTYDTGLMEAFFIPAGTVLEIYGTTLHYAPCGVDGTGFRCVVILPEGTNTELTALEGREGEDALLFARNKWLIAHADSGLMEKGAYTGLTGVNITV